MDYTAQENPEIYKVESLIRSTRSYKLLTETPEADSRNVCKNCNLLRGCEIENTFPGYGIDEPQHPMYRTTSKSYGYYPPNKFMVPSVYRPSIRKFSKHLLTAGMRQDTKPTTALDDKLFDHGRCKNPKEHYNLMDKIYSM